MGLLKSENFDLNKKNNLILLLIIILLTASMGTLFSVLTLTFREIFGFTRLYSVGLFATFMALLYCFSIIGGIFGGRITSYVYAVNIGLFLTIIGAIGLYSHQSEFLFLSLSLLIVGYGLISPCIISIFGENLKQEISDHSRFVKNMQHTQDVKHERHHSRFVLNYMAMNIGGVLGVGLSGLWGRPDQYLNNVLCEILFLFGIFVLFNYFFSKKKLKASSKICSRIWSMSFLCIAIIAVYQLLRVPYVADSFLIGIGLFSVGYVLFLGKKQEIFYFRRLVYFVFLTGVTVVFFVLYNAEPDILTLFIEDHVNRSFGGIKIPAATYFMLNPIFNLIFGGVIFFALKSAKKTFSPDIWIYCGIFLMGFGFWVLWIATFFASNSNANLSSGWILLVYAVLSVAEMLVAPVAYEIIFLYGAPSLYGIMSGMSQLAVGLGAFLTGKLSNFIIPKSGVDRFEGLHFFAHGFEIIGIIWMVFGLVFLGLRLSLLKLDA